MRYLFLTHRYLGIAVSTLMTMWCLSGIVMMYVSYPRLAPSTRIASLPPLDLTRCCAPIDAQVIPADEQVSALQIEMLGNRLLAEVELSARRVTIDLNDGSLAASVTLEHAVVVADRFAKQAGLASQHRSVVKLQDDQWTISEEFAAQRPLYKFTWADPARSELYVSSISGKAVQYTTATVRLWNWLGAIPHWLYFTRLRRHGEAWSQLVIGTSLAGCFLAITGIFIGVRQFWRRPQGSPSPYRGFMVWHHIPGLLFGIFLLTWVASGLLSMNPWGLLEGTGADAERQALQGSLSSWQAVRASLQRLGHKSILQEAVSLNGTTNSGRVHYVATLRDGHRIRLSEDGTPAELSLQEMDAMASILAGKVHKTLELLSAGDEFYFSHPDRSVVLPVYRVQLADRDQTSFYLDSVSGEVLMKVDADARGYRWLHDFPHRLDFPKGLLRRPTWDLVMLTLLLGVLLITLTGLYAALRRLRGRGKTLEITSENYT